MKQLKKLLMMLMCVGVIMSVAACGSKNNADDNGAVNDGTTNDAGTGTGNGNNNTGNDNGNTNGATDGTDNKKDEGLMDEIGDDIRDGADDVGDALDGNDDNVRDNGTDNNRQVCKKEAAAPVGVRGLLFCVSKCYKVGWKKIENIIQKPPDICYNGQQKIRIAREVCGA